MNTFIYLFFMLFCQVIVLGVNLDRIGEERTTKYKTSGAIITILMIIWTAITIYLEMSK